MAANRVRFAFARGVVVGVVWLSCSAAMSVASAQDEPSAESETERPAHDAKVASTPGIESPGEQPTSLARAELAAFQTLHGAALGAELCLIADCEGARPWIAAPVAGAGAGLGLSLALSSNGVRPGHALALNSGVLWGTWDGFLTYAAINPDVENHSRALGASLALGQVAGMGLGASLFEALEPTGGQVALTNAGGIWSTATTMLLFAATDAYPDESTFALVLLGTSKAGLLGAGLLASQIDISRGRVMLIHTAGALGMGVGMGLDVLVEGDDFQRGAFFGAGTAGALVGLGLGYALTRDWDVDDVPAQLGIAPVEGGAVASVRGTL